MNKMKKKEIIGGLLGGILLSTIIVVGYNGLASNKGEILESIKNTNELPDVSSISVAESTNAYVIETEKGKVFYALYDKSLSGNNNIRVIAGDSYLLHSNKLFPYVTTEEGNKYTLPNHKEYSAQEIESKREKIQEQQERIASLDKKNNNLETEKNNLSKEIDLVKKSKKELEKRVTELLEKMEVQYGIEPKKSESKSGDITQNGSASKIDIPNESNITNNSNSNSNSSRISMTTKDRLMQKIPEEKRDEVEKELNQYANVEYKKEAMRKISQGISDFTIDYPSYTNEEKGVITAFVDPTCPYCKKLHNDLDKLRYKGYTVRYLPIPKDGMDSSIVPQIAEVSCASKENAPQLMDRLFSGERFATNNTPEICTKNISRYFKLAIDLGASQTPYVFNDQGYTSNGYQNIEKLTQDLHLEK